jgi:hypothetical protein
MSLCLYLEGSFVCFLKQATTISVQTVMYLSYTYLQVTWDKLYKLQVEKRRNITCVYTQSIPTQFML